MYIASPDPCRVTFRAARSGLRSTSTPAASSPGGCRAVESICADFLDAVLPPDPSLLFFFDPCSEALLPRVLDQTGRSLREHPRPIHLAYVAPGRKEALLDRADFLVKTGSNAERQIYGYRNR